MRWPRQVALAVSLALATQAAVAARPMLLAQADSSNPPPAQIDPSQAGGSNRSIFLALFANNFVPIVASGLANWFRAKVFGQPGEANADASGQGQSQGAAPAAAPAGQASAAAPVASADSSQEPPAGGQTRGAAPVHAGIAYQVWLLGADGARTPVDPASRVFASGERFEVDYRPNFPGTIEVFNVDPAGKQERIDRLELAAAELGKLGPYEFGGVKGEEQLRIVLYPCLSSRTSGEGGGTRGISKVQIKPEVTKALGGCAPDGGGAPPAVATRSISKVAREGATSFALDPVSQGEIAAGKILPREIVLRFQHQ